MILLQRPNASAARCWITIAALPEHFGTGQHHASTLYVCPRCGNPSWRRLVDGYAGPFNIDSHPCASCKGYFPLVDSDFERLREATQQSREAIAELSFQHPNILIRTYLHHYQEPRNAAGN